jgi:uncharacterized Ntn-hydrolase superfamily protein
VTYSIVAANVATREVGGAGASCLTGDDVYVIYAARPGRGVVHAQAHYDADARDHAAELLGRGVLPADIVRALTAPAFDSNAAIRQYGIVDVIGNSAGFTGQRTTPFAADGQGAFGDFAYSVQGNILTSARVLDRAAVAFQAAGCDLPERLMNALEAGAERGEGDSRCTPAGIPSDSAFLQVEHPDVALGAYLSLRVESSGANDPLPLLRAKLNAWRVEHPCPAAPSMPPASSNVSEDGCGCRSAAPSSDAWTLLLGGCLVVAWWRRRRAATQLGPAHLT